MKVKNISSKWRMYIILNNLLQTKFSLIIFPKIKLIAIFYSFIYRYVLLYEIRQFKFNCAMKYLNEISDKEACEYLVMNLLLSR